MENNQLYHHGILGMKWGVRRFQNKDGSLTKAGKKRYGDDSDEQKAKKKSVKDMSDDELNKAIRRAQMEDQYRNLRPEKVSTGRKFFGTLGSKVIAPALIGAGENFLRKALTQYGDDILKKNPSEMDKLKKEYEKLDLQDKIKKLKNKEANETWDDRLKKQDYERKEKQKKLDDLDRDLKYEQKKKEYDDWMAESRTTTRGETFIAELLEAPEEVDS